MYRFKRAGSCLFLLVSLLCVVCLDAALAENGPLGNWTRRTSGTTQDFRSIAYGANKFVAVGANGTIVSSPTGSSWTRRNTGGTRAYLYDIAFGGGRFVAVGEQISLISTDGIRWTKVMHSESDFLTSVKYFKGSFVALSRNGADTCALISTDGVQWNRSQRIGDPVFEFGGSDNLLVGLGNQYVYTSSNAINWTPRKISERNSSSFSGVAFGNGIFCVGRNTEPVYTSYNGFNWVEQTLPDGEIYNPPFVNLAFEGGLLVGTGYYSTFATSTDGKVWTAHPVTARQDIYFQGAAYGRGTYVVVGSEGMIFQSKTFDTSPDTLSIARKGLASEFGRQAKFEVSRRGSLLFPLVVSVQISGKAINGTDYEPIPTSFIIPAGVNSATIFLIPILDTIGEEPEDVELTLIPSPTYLVSKSSASATASIIDASAFVGGKTFDASSGSINRWNFSKKRLTKNDLEHWYRVSSNAAIPINITVTGPYVKGSPTYETESGQRVIGRRLAALNANIGLELYDKAGTLIETQDRDGDGPEFIRRSGLSEAGDYYIRVFSSGGSAGIPLVGVPYIVMVSGGDNWDVVDGTVKIGALSRSEAHHVGVFPYPGSIRPDRQLNECWIVTHGRTDHPGTFVSLAENIGALRPVSSIMLLDWSTAADSEGLEGGYWFDKVGASIANMLSSGERSDGGVVDELNLVGHSWGTYINHESAKSFYDTTAKRVARMVVLDPALDAGNYTVSNVAFGDYSDYSLGFWSSALGSIFTVLTCADSFDLEISTSRNPLVRHNASHEVFRRMLLYDDSISKEIRRVLFERALPIWSTRDDEPLNTELRYTGSPTGYTPPFFSGISDGFEGKIFVDSVRRVMRGATLYYRSRGP